MRQEYVKIYYRWSVNSRTLMGVLRRDIFARVKEELEKDCLLTCNVLEVEDLEVTLEDFVFSIEKTL